VGVLGDTEPALRVETIDGSQSLSSVHARMSHTRPAGFAVDGGVLLTHASSAAFSPWVTTTLPFGPLVLRAGAGIYRQYPDLAQRVGSFGTADVRPERSRQVDVAIEYAWRPETRAQVTFYDRREWDTLRLEGDDYKLVEGVIVPPSLEPVWTNALDGGSRGVELLLQRRAVAGVSGWISYSFSRTRHTDKYAGERFYADYDQRHTFSGYVQYRLSPVTSLSAKLRIGSNFPIPGYLERRAEAIFLTSERNQVRLPTYARLDLRANRAFNFDRRRLTLFVEIINVVGRTNYTTDAFRVLPSGQVFGATQRLFPFLPTAGISFDF
jgi:outer membrane cobalamin receptor